MNSRILLVALEQETDIIVARQRARLICGLLGFEAQDQTRVTTAVSEIVRNALEYGGGGRIEFRVSGEAAAQSLEIIVKDTGPGIADTASVLAGTHHSTTGMGIGIVGAQRLMDGFAIESSLGYGTIVRMSKLLPNRGGRPLTTRLKEIGSKLSEPTGIDPIAEVRRQNQDMVLQLDELRQRQQELDQLNQELQDTNRGVVALYAELDERASHLRRADDLKSRFLSNMSHEFRTPLNSILALSRLLLSRVDGELGGEQEKQVLFIRKAAENLTELVNDLLDLAKVEAGKTLVTPAEFSAGDLFSTLRGMLRPLLVGDRLALIFEDTMDVPPLFTDEGKVGQILRNFISNAIKFTETGEVRIWADADRSGETVSFHVRDTGIGIAEQDLELIWQEFGQVPHALQSRVKGTGLGLPLSRKLAQLLRGDVAVQSAPDQGSVFSLTIPRIFKSRFDVAEEKAWRVEPGRVPILALEDNEADLFALERSLSGTQYQIIHARTTDEARRACDNFVPAAILLDILLEGEETWRFLIETKQRRATESIPIIVISTSNDERKARNLGADEYLDKPVDPRALVQVLDELTANDTLLKVLIVDDQEVFRYLVRQLLPRGAYDLAEATNGVDGLELLRQSRPDVLLLDLNMDRMDGFEFLDRLAKMDGSDTLPVIVVTSMALDETRRSRLARASRIVEKSELTSETLTSAIRTAINSHEARPQ